MLISKEWYTDKRGKRRGKALLKCDTCGNKYTTSIDNYYQYRKRNGGDITHCKSCTCKKNSKKLIGLIPWNKGKVLDERRRENAVNWNGGRYISSDGYYMILIQSGPNTGNGWSKYKKEHQVIAEQILGRKLNKQEIVHHIDGNKLNNNIDNLAIIDNDIKHHRLTHDSLMRVGYQLYKLGIVKYDKINHKYEIGGLYGQEQFEGSGI